MSDVIAALSAALFWISALTGHYPRGCLLCETVKCLGRLLAGNGWFPGELQLNALVALLASATSFGVKLGGNHSNQVTCTNHAN